MTDWKERAESSGLLTVSDSEGGPPIPGVFAVSVERDFAVWGMVLTTLVIAERAGVTVGRVRQLLRAGRFPNAFKIGRQWLVPESDVNAYLAYPDTRRKDIPKQGTLPGVDNESA